MTKRIFVAVDITKPAQNKIAQIINDLKNKFPDLPISWMKSSKLHFTLKFLGEIDDQQLRKLFVAVEQTAKKIAPFQLQISETIGVFPSAKNARILYFNVIDENGILQKLNSILEDECQIQGFHKEARDFKAHLTIARLKKKPNNDIIKEILQTVFEQEKPFKVSEISIYESELLPIGSVYKSVKKVLLGS